MNRDPVSGNEKVDSPYFEGREPAQPPGRGRKASAKQILKILDSRANHKGVKKQFDRLLSDSSRELAEAVASVPNPSNPYMALVRLPTAFRKLRWLSTRQTWYKKVFAFRMWLHLYHEQREMEANRLRAALTIQNWVRREQARMRLALITERVPESGDGSSQVKSWKLKIIASIRADAATKIQTSVRLHILNVSRMKRELDVISLYRQNKAARRIQCIFRGYFCRSLRCVAEKIALHKQLKEWAKGTTTKLLYQAHLQDLGSQKLLNAGIYAAALGSRPLRNLPSLQKLKLLRSQLRKLQVITSSDHLVMREEYRMRQLERVYMGDEDRLSYFCLIQYKLSIAATEKEKQELQEMVQRLRYEALKVQQRRNAMSVMAFSSLEENNQRVEREEMFREENRMRKLNLARYRSARSLLEYNRELMLKEDFRAQDQRMILLRRQAEDETMRVQLSKIREICRRQDTSVSRNPSMEYFEALKGITDQSVFTFLPWWLRVRVPLEGEALRLAQVPSIIAAGFQSPSATYVKDLKEKTSNTNLGATISNNARRNLGRRRPAYLQYEQANFSLELSVAGLHEKNEYVRKKRRLHKGTVTVQCGVNVLVSPSMLKGRELLSRIRLRRRERECGYISVCENIAIFVRSHTALNEARRALVSTKHETRATRKKQAMLCSELEFKLPSRRAELVRRCRHLGDLCRREIKALLELFLWHLTVNMAAGTEGLDDSIVGADNGADSSAEVVAKEKDIRINAGGAATDTGTSTMNIDDTCEVYPMVSKNLHSRYLLRAPTNNPLLSLKSENFLRGIGNETDSITIPEESISQAGAIDENSPVTREALSQKARLAFWGADTEALYASLRSSMTRAAQAGSKRSNGAFEGCKLDASLPPSYPIETTEHDSHSQYEGREAPLPVPTSLHDPSNGKNGRNSKTSSSFSSTPASSDSDTGEKEYLSDNSVDSSLGASSRASAKGKKPRASSRLTDTRSNRRMRQLQRRKEAEEEQRRAAGGKQVRRTVLGFEIFLFPTSEEYDFVRWARRIQAWCSSLRDWTTRLEEYWRDIHRDFIITNLQRLQWLERACLPSASTELNTSEGKRSGDSAAGPKARLNVAGSVEGRSSIERRAEDNLKEDRDFIGADDATASALASKEGVLDLLELDICRSDIEIRITRSYPVHKRVTRSLYDLGVKQNMASKSSPINSDQEMHIILSSSDAEKMLGRHPFSLAALFLMQNGLNGGTLRDIRRQYNRLQYSSTSESAFSPPLSKVLFGPSGTCESARQSMQGSSRWKGRKNLTVTTSGLATALGDANLTYSSSPNTLGKPRASDASKNNHPREVSSGSDKDGEGADPDTTSDSSSPTARKVSDVRVSNAMGILRSRMKSINSGTSPVSAVAEGAGAGEADGGQSGGQLHHGGSSSRKSPPKISPKGKNKARTGGEDSREVQREDGKKTSAILATAIRPAVMDTLRRTVGPSGDIWFSSGLLRRSLMTQRLSAKEAERNNDQNCNDTTVAEQCEILLGADSESNPHQEWCESVMRQVSLARSCIEQGEHYSSLLHWTSAGKQLLFYPIRHSMDSYAASVEALECSEAGDHNAEDLGLDFTTVDFEHLLEHLERYELHPVQPRKERVQLDPLLEAAMGVSNADDDWKYGQELATARMVIFAAVCKYLGDALMETDRLEAAKDRYFASRALREHLFGSGHLSVAEVDLSIAELYTRSAMYIEADAALGEASFSLEEAESRVDRQQQAGEASGLTSPEPPITGSAVCDWGYEDREQVMFLHLRLHDKKAALYWDTCRYAESGLSARKALATCTALAKERGGDFYEALSIPAKSIFGRIHAMLGDNGESIRVLEESTTAAVRAYGEHHPQVAELLLNRAQVCVEDMPRHHVEEPLERATAIIMNKIHPTVSEVSALLVAKIFETRAALCAHYDGDYRQACMHAMNALTIQRRVLGDRHPTCSHTRGMLADIALEAGAPMAALQICDEVIRERETLAQTFPLDADCQGMGTSPLLGGSPSSNGTANDHYPFKAGARSGAATVIPVMRTRARALEMLQDLPESLSAYDALLHNLTSTCTSLTDFRAVEFHDEDEGKESDLTGRMPFMVVEKIKLDRVTALMTAGDLAAAGEQLMSIHHAILSLLREREDLLPCQCITSTHSSFDIGSSQRADMHTLDTSDEHLEERFGSLHPLLAYSLFVQGTLACQQGNHDTADELLDHAASMEEMVRSPSHPRIARTLLVISQNLLAAGGSKAHIIETANEALSLKMIYSNDLKHGNKCSRGDRLAGNASEKDIHKAVNAELLAQPGEGWTWTPYFLHIADILRESSSPTDVFEHQNPDMANNTVPAATNYYERALNIITAALSFKGLSAAAIDALGISPEIKIRKYATQGAAWKARVFMHFGEYYLKHADHCTAVKYLTKASNLVASQSAHPALVNADYGCLAGLINSYLALAITDEKYLQERAQKKRIIGDSADEDEDEDEDEIECPFAIDPHASYEELRATAASLLELQAIPSLERHFSPQHTALLRAKETLASIKDNKVLSDTVCVISTAHSASNNTLRCTRRARKLSSSVSALKLQPPREEGNNPSQTETAEKNNICDGDNGVACETHDQTGGMMSMVTEGEAVNAGGRNTATEDTVADCASERLRGQLEETTPKLQLPPLVNGSPALPDLRALPDTRAEASQDKNYRKGKDSVGSAVRTKRQMEDLSPSQLLGMLHHAADEVNIPENEEKNETRNIGDERHRISQYEEAYLSEREAQRLVLSAVRLQDERLQLDRLMTRREKEAKEWLERRIKEEEQERERVEIAASISKQTTILKPGLLSNSDRSRGSLGWRKVAAATANLTNNRDSKKKGKEPTDKGGSESAGQGEQTSPTKTSSVTSQSPTASLNRRSVKNRSVRSSPTNKNSAKSSEFQENCEAVSIATLMTEADDADEGLSDSASDVGSPTFRSSIAFIGEASEADNDKEVGNGLWDTLRKGVRVGGGDSSPHSPSAASRPSPSTSSPSQSGTDSLVDSTVPRQQSKERQRRSAFRGRTSPTDSLGQSTSSKRPGRKFRVADYEGEMFDFSVHSRKKTLSTASLLEKTKLAFWEDDPQVMIREIGSRGSSNQNNRQGGRQDAALRDESEAKAKAKPAIDIDTPSAHFLAYYHREEFASALIQEEVAQAEDMVKRMAARGLLNLITVDHSLPHTHIDSDSTKQYHLQESNHHDVELNIATEKLRPNVFVGHWLSLDHWEVTVPPWMRPVAYAGREAGPEPFWRRLLLEQRSGLTGKYTKIYEKDERIDRVARRMVETMYRRAAVSRICYNALVSPAREESERLLMDWEDALSLVVRQYHSEKPLKWASYDKGGTNSPSKTISRSPHVTPGSPTNAISFGETPLSASAVSTPTSLGSSMPSPSLKVSEKTRVLSRPIHIKLPSTNTGFFTSLFRRLGWAKISPESAEALHNKVLEGPPTHQAAVMLVRAIRYAEKSLQRGVDAVTMTRDLEATSASLRVKQKAKTDIEAVMTDVEMRVRSLVRTTSWVTGEAVSIDPQTGKLRPAASSKSSDSPGRKDKESKDKESKDKPNGFARLRALAGIQPSTTMGETSKMGESSNCAPSVDRLHSNGSLSKQTANMTDARMSELKRAQQELDSRTWPAIPEVWVFGGCRDGTVIFMRVVDSDEIPRGGAVSEVASGPGAWIIRTGFAGRKALCDDNYKQYRDLRNDLALLKTAAKGVGSEHLLPSTTALSAKRAKQQRAYASINQRESHYQIYSPLQRPWDRFSFADYVTTEGRVLAISSLQRHRYAGSVTPDLELPRSPSMYRNIVREVYDSRHAFVESRMLVEKLQGILRMRRARERIRLLKEAVQADVDSKRRKRKGQSKRDRAQEMDARISKEGVEQPSKPLMPPVPIIMTLDKEMEAFV